MKRTLFSLLLASLPCLSAYAVDHALVVGVSSYPRLDEHFQLKGPRYDAEMVDGFLRSNPYRRFDDVTTLADRVEGAQSPTREAILKALDDLAKQALPDEFVYLHFSGHGSRAPAKHPETETDGLDELFLPADIGHWNDAVGEVENALVDDELGARIAAIRAKGAFVWAVFDSCHSGTVTRGAPAGDDVRERRVPESALGIPDDVLIHVERGPGEMAMRGLPSGGLPSGDLINRETMLDEARPRGLPDGATQDAPGGFVAFYAAQSTETTPEMRLPRGEEGRVPHGLFTFTLFQVIAEHPGITYRQAAQEVLRRYATSYMTSPTPLFEGDLDRPVLGIDAAEVRPQWPVTVSADNISIPAGQLQGLGTGTRLALLPGPAATEAEALGWLEVTKAETLSSTLRILGLEGKSAPSAQTLAEGAYARLLTRPISFELRVARPLLPDEAEGAHLQAILDGLKPADDSGLRLSWVAPGEPADIRLGWTAAADGVGAQLWLLPPTGDRIDAGPSKTPSIILDGKTDAEVREVLSDSLARIARVANLLRLGEALGASTDLDARLRIRRGGEGALIDMDPATAPRVHPGDEVHLSARNPGKEALDVNVLFVGSDYSISHMYKERIHPGGSLNAGLLRVTGDSFGPERVLLIAVPAAKMSEVQDLSFLEQRALPKTRAHTEGFAALLGEVGFGLTTRGAAPLGGGAGASASAEILQFPLLTLPND